MPDVQLDGWKWKIAHVELKLRCCLIPFMWPASHLSPSPRSLPLEVLGTFFMEIKTLILRHGFSITTSLFGLFGACLCIFFLRVPLPGFKPWRVANLVFIVAFELLLYHSLCHMYSASCL